MAKIVTPSGAVYRVFYCREGQLKGQDKSCKDVEAIVAKINETMKEQDMDLERHRRIKELARQIVALRSGNLEDKDKAERELTANYFRPDWNDVGSDLTDAEVAQLRTEIAEVGYDAEDEAEEGLPLPDATVETNLRVALEKIEYLRAEIKGLKAEKKLADVEQDSPLWHIGKRLADLENRFAAALEKQEETVWEMQAKLNEIQGKRLDVIEERLNKPDPVMFTPDAAETVPNKEPPKLADVETLRQQRGLSPLEVAAMTCGPKLGDAEQRLRPGLPNRNETKGVNSILVELRKRYIETLENEVKRLKKSGS